MAITATTLTLADRLRADLDRIVDTQVRDLVRAWATAWDEVEPDLNATLVELLLTPGDRITRAQMLRSQRLRTVLTLVAEQLTTLAETSRVRITGDLQAVIDAAGAAQASIIDSQLPPGADQLVDLDAWSRVDARQVQAIVTRSTEQITALHRPLAPEAYDIVRRELIRGVAAGSNPRRTAARMVRRAERVGFNGGLTRALTIARTETLDAHRAAAYTAQQQHADVLAGWEWLAQLDSRTCPSCWARHGTVHDLATPGPIDHQQGRCTRLPVTRSWADLGFDIDEPPSLMPDAEATFASLTPGEQLAILGPARYEAWMAGDFPMSGWSQLRRTEGWRDSYGVAPVPAGYGRSGSSSRGRSRRSAA